MRRLASAVIVAMTTVGSSAQVPGDRPARESSGDALSGHGAQRHHCDQPAAGLGGRARGPAEGRQRHRCRGHGGRGPLGRRTDDERDRRGPVCAGLRPEDEDGARAQRQWTRAGGGDDRGVQAAQPRRHALSRRAVGQRARASWTAGASCSPNTARSASTRHCSRRSATRKDGYAVSEIISYQWKDQEATLARDPGGRRDVPHRWTRPARRRDLPQSEARRVAGADRQRRTRRVLQRSDRQGDRRRHAAAQGAAHRRGPRGAHVRLDRADLDRLQGPPGPRVSTEHPGRRRARDAEHPRGRATSRRWDTTAPPTCTCSSRPRRSPSRIAMPGWRTRRRRRPKR